MFVWKWQRFNKTANISYHIIQMFVCLGEYDISWNDRVRLGDKTKRIKLCSKCTVQASNVHVGIYM